MLPKELAPEKMVCVESLEDAQDLLSQDFRVEYMDTSLEHIQISEDGTVLVDNTALPYTPSFMESAARRIGMPLHYAHRIDFDLFKHNFDTRKQTACRGIKVCVCSGVAVNLARDNYQPAKTLDMIKSLPENMARWQFHEAVVSGHGVELSWLDETIRTDPQPGDTIVGGVRISNSETGFRGLKASEWTLRLQCLNGAVVADENRVLRWSHDRRVTYASNVQKFCKELEALELRQDELEERYRVMVNSSVQDRQAVALWRQIDRLVGPQRADLLLGIPSVDRRQLFRRVLSYQDPQEANPTDLSAYEVHNRITASAKELDFSRRRRLEEIGKRMLINASKN